MFKKIFISSFFLLGLIAPGLTQAATLSMVPSSSSVTVGKTISVKVSVNTQGKYINNSEALIQFPKDLFEVVSISKNSSIFSLWVEEPTFSNFLGHVSFNGGVANPGFLGTNGTVASITLRAKKEGKANISFLSASVRENDGLGTDILSGNSGTTINIQPAKNIEKTIDTEEPVYSEVESILAIPQIYLSAFEIQKGQWINIFGKTENVDQKVNLNIETKGELIEQHTLDVSGNGFFTYSTNSLKNVGEFSIWSEDILPDGTLGLSSEKISLNVVDKNLVKISINKFLLGFIATSVALLAIFTYLGWSKYLILKKKE